MRLRVLVIDDQARAKVARVIDYAKLPEHWYHPAAFYTQTKPDQSPGNNGNLVVHLDTYRCVFSYTVAENKLWKHLSVSVPGPFYAHYIAMFAIANLFYRMGRP